MCLISSDAYSDAALFNKNNRVDVLSINRSTNEKNILLGLEKQEKNKFDEAIIKSGPFWKVVKTEEQGRWLRVVKKKSLASQIVEYQKKIKELEKYIRYLPKVDWMIIRTPKNYDVFPIAEINKEGRVVLVFSTYLYTEQKRVFIDIDILTGEEKAYTFWHPSIITSIKDMGGKAMVNGGVFLDNTSWDAGWLDISFISFTIQKSKADKMEVFYPVYISDSEDMIDGAMDEETSILPVFKWVACSGSIVGSSPGDQVFVKITDISQIKRGGIINNVFFLDQTDIDLYERRTNNVQESYGALFSRKKAGILKSLLNLK